MRSSRKENKEWFGNIFNENYEYIRNYLYYLSGDMELAEDLVQDVFLQLWEKKDSIKDETVRAFLFTVAKNDFLKSTRRKKNDLKFRSAIFENSENKSPEYILEMKEFDEKLQRIISEIPEKSRAVFLMHRIDGMTYNEIAGNLKVTVKAIEKQMSKALSILNEKLGKKI
ncbi:MAG TPA: RNA polymerase sigma-70 factor [Tangfeifania sp.]|nr:RNA polymerase sigma-70 factor [Tangfeifania sp.]